MQVNIPAARLEIIERVAAHARKTEGARGGRTRAGFESFIHSYYRGVAEEDLATHGTDHLAALARVHLAFGGTRQPGTPLVAVLNPDPATEGLGSRHTLVLVVTDDMPFLLDSLGIVLNQSGLAMHFIVHPVIRVQRDARGRLLDLPDDAAAAAGRLESWQLFEIDRETDPDRLAGLRERLLATLDDVRCATGDWPEMRQRARDLAGSLEAQPPPLPSSDVLEAKALLEWMDDNHFTFLGYREYRLKRGRTEDLLEPLPASGLGLLRPNRVGRGPPKPTRLTGEIRDFGRSRDLLVITKANTFSTVHRGTYLDYFGVKTFDAQGEVTGERRFIGLWTSSAYSGNPRKIPVLRHRVQQVIAHFGLSPTSHDGKAIIHVLENYPRDELFQASIPDLIRIARGIVNLYDRAQVRMFVRRDAFRRFYSCLVYVPRDRYNTLVRQRIEAIVREAFGGLAIESQVQMSESVLARLHLLVRTDPATNVVADVGRLEQSLTAAVRTWQDHFKDALLARHDGATALRLHRAYAGRFAAAYLEDAQPAAAVDDVAALESLGGEASGLGMSLYRAAGQTGSKLQFKLFRRGRPLPICDVLPTIENMGLRLISERPYELAGPEPLWIQDFELEHPGGMTIDVAADGPRFKDTFASVWLGGADNDGFNRLVLAAGLTWREAMVLRSYGRWLLQLGVPFSQPYMEQVLASNARAAAHLAGLFVCRFDPALAERKRAEFSAQHEHALDDLLNAVTRPDDDRILRAFRAAIDATVRTNFFQPGADGRPKPYLSLKLEPRKVPDSPLPRPQYEIFVHSPRVEGVHLRMGKVARGGIRWSDRREDFRTEVLGLMKAQNVKNTLIVPVGAKGGFVPRRPPATREEIQREGTECYRIFIRALLDLTDNIVAGKLVPPRQVVRRDEDDPYLVVAADKGTATFSDVANALSLEYGHWLGDAFASGGSAGYDHKRMGITARGGWESVKRHFRELGMDTQQQDFTVAGIGDMAGDVFGNGMLLSKHIKLLAAFNHLHIFLDPSPDPARSFAERRRLFDLPRSSWEDCDARLISKGGGVFSRQAKAIPLSPEARRMLGVEAAAAAPNDVIRAILRMPVDLLWNGGIGTYVKSSQESNAQIGDRANDAVRVDGRELRCKVIGEGGNLGCSQPGRVEYALRGGRLNSDFIDNSAGVNTSDVEVNIKILTNSLTESGRLKRADRDRLLARMTDEVAALVLRNNYLQSQAISTLEAHASVRLAEHSHVIRMLEKSGELNRALESLPADDELAERQRAGKGLTRPELAMILSYSKIWLYDRLIRSDVPEDPYLGRELTRYFPKPIQQRFGNDLLQHRLRREIIATAATNSLVNRMGPVFAIRAQEDTGADLGTIARAYTIAREITGIRTLWAEIEALDNKVPAALQYDMMYETSRLLRHLTYWVLANLGANLDIEAAVSRLQPGLGDLMQSLPRLVEGVEASRYAQSLTRYSRDGVPEGLARRIASLGAAQAAVDIAEIALQLKVGVEHAGRAYFGMGTSTGLDWVRGEIERLAVEGHWQAVARATLREEAFMLQRRLASQAIKAGGKRDAAGAVAAWVAARERYAELVRRTIHEMQSTGAADFPTLSVALQSVRRLTEH